MRILLLVAFVLLAVASACGDGSDTPASIPTSTYAPLPTRTPIDVQAGCALSPPADRECRELSPSCPVSDVWDVSAHIASGIGQPPVWMIASPVRGFSIARNEEGLNKTIWLVEDGVEGNVTVTGRRLDGPGVMTFPHYERDPGAVEERQTGDYRWDRTELVLVPPHGRLSDHRTFISYPSPGCWQFTARTETETVEIVQYLYDDE